MHKEITRQHPVFIKYTRAWLYKATGYSKGYLSRMATGKSPLTRAFIERASLKLSQPEDELFNQVGGQCLTSGGCATSALGEWLEKKCQKEHLSFRQAATKTGLSHATIAQVISSGHALPETIKKLAQAFGGDGKRGLALEDYLLTLAGYRTPRPEGEEPSEAFARLLDKVSELSELQIKIMVRFADFLIETEDLKSQIG